MPVKSHSRRAPTRSTALALQQRIPHDMLGWNALRCSRVPHLRSTVHLSTVVSSTNRSVMNAFACKKVDRRYCVTTGSFTHISCIPSHPIAVLTTSSGRTFSTRPPMGGWLAHQESQLIWTWWEKSLSLTALDIVGVLHLLRRAVSGGQFQMGFATAETWVLLQLLVAYRSWHLPVVPADGHPTDASGQRPFFIKAHSMAGVPEQQVLSVYSSPEMFPEALRAGLAAKENPCETWCMPGAEVLDFMRRQRLETDYRLAGVVINHPQWTQFLETNVDFPFCALTDEAASPMLKIAASSFVLTQYLKRGETSSSDSSSSAEVSSVPNGQPSEGASLPLDWFSLAAVDPEQSLFGPRSSNWRPEQWYALLEIPTKSSGRTPQDSSTDSSEREGAFHHRGLSLLIFPGPELALRYQQAADSASTREVTPIEMHQIHSLLQSPGSTRSVAFVFRVEADGRYRARVLAAEDVLQRMKEATPSPA